MKVNIRHANVLRLTTPQRVINLLQEHDLYNKMIAEIGNKKTNKSFVVKKYMQILGNVSYLNSKIYEWSER